MLVDLASNHICPVSMRQNRLSLLFSSALFTASLCLVILAVAGCESPREEVWLDDIESIPVSSESSTSDPSLYSNEPLAFEDFFEYVGETQLSDDLIFGSMASPIVGPQGQILVIDREQAGLFDRQGKLINSVHPDACHPGFDFRPMKAAFLPNGGFLVLTLMAQGFWFDEVGNCTTKLPHQPYLDHFALSPDSTLTSYRINRNDWRIMQYGLTESSVDTLHKGSAPRLAYRVKGGGMVKGEGNDWFIAAAHSPFVYRYRNGRFEKLGYVPGYFRPIQEDLTEEEQADVQLMMQSMSRIMGESSTTGWLYKLGDDLLVLRYQRVQDGTADKRTPGALHIMNFDGNPVTQGPLFLGEFNPSDFANGSMYLRQYDQSGLDDAPLNPKIVEYRFIGR